MKLEEIAKCCPSPEALDWSLLIGSVADLLWPTIVIFVLLLLLPIVVRFIRESSSVEMEAGGFKLAMSRQTKDLIVQPILDEMNFVLSSLSRPDRDLFMSIYQDIESGKGYSVPPDFERGNALHAQLRSLRELNLIRPTEGGRWQPGKPVELTRFAKVFGQVKRTELRELFGGQAGADGA